VRELATIGIYGWTLQSFLTSLQEHGIALVIDIRQRRGVRGREYAWANAARLQAALLDARIEYRHHKELAPTTELRRLQYREDAAHGVAKRNRARLAPEYRRRYAREVLDRADLRRLTIERSAALLCVEREPEACHRSLAAEGLAREHGFRVVHLLPRE
jgi:uncharacterized protein (DUF488 family)